MLTLPIKKKWFDMIKSGEKKEEYREIKPYWDSRFRGWIDWPDNEFEVLFRNGYLKNSPTIKCLVHILEDYGKPEWGAEPNKLYYVLKILSVEKMKKKIKDNVDLKELEKFGFEKIDGFPIQYKRKYKDLELDTDMYILVDSRNNSLYITKDTYLLYDFNEETDNKYIEDLIKADLVEEVSNDNN